MSGLSEVRHGLAQDDLVLDVCVTEFVRMFVCVFVLLCCVDVAWCVRVLVLCVSELLVCVIV